MDTKFSIGDKVYYANADGTVIVHIISKIIIQETPQNSDGIGIAYYADKKGNERAMSRYHVFATEKEARDFLLNEQQERHEKIISEIKEKPLNEDYISPATT